MKHYKLENFVTLEPKMKNLVTNKTQTAVINMEPKRILVPCLSPRFVFCFF